ncbi:hypothetical protein K402DRAFT_390769 [Aulographum hederae CBS 113979]|uniref:Uncharacterized protein n=1 Tax=Aulographum hederae CBS 113979 TaxID=1176131 RepID=A0A6G1H9F9_9PEZI|nr:hypothetical protein K402DRAFT_390769 [Aulographum hederae CBS 113979]
MLPGGDFLAATSFLSLTALLYLLYFAHCGPSAFSGLAWHTVTALHSAGCWRDSLLITRYRKRASSTLAELRFCFNFSPLSSNLQFITHEALDCASSLSAVNTQPFA